MFIFSFFNVATGNVDTIFAVLIIPPPECHGELLLGEFSQPPPTPS
jgi:hypothetical protein